MIKLRSKVKLTALKRHSVSRHINCNESTVNETLLTEMATSFFFNFRSFRPLLTIALM
jgi:hypothetical protein